MGRSPGTVVGMVCESMELHMIVVRMEADFRVCEKRRRSVARTRRRGTIEKVY